LYFLLTGTSPNVNADGVYLGDEYLASKEFRATPVQNRSADVPADLARICMRCLKRDPKARYKTADELRDELLQWYSQHSVEGKLFLKLYRYLGAPAHIPTLSAQEIAERTCALLGADRVVICPIESPAVDAVGDCPEKIETLVRSHGKTIGRIIAFREQPRFTVYDRTLLEIIAARIAAEKEHVPTASAEREKGEGESPALEHDKAVMTVLVIDKDTSLSNYVENALRAEGFSTKWTDDTDTAEELICPESERSGEYALVILSIDDLHNREEPSDSDGFTFLKKLRKLTGCSYRELPVIAMSQYPLKHRQLTEKEVANEDMANAFFEKLCDLGELADTAKKLVDNSQSLP